MLSSRFAVALHLLVLQALQDEGELLPSETMAGSVGTNPVVVRRLLGLLRRAGLVQIQAGARGGARLARGAGRIRLAQVYRAVEGRQAGLLSLHKHPPNRRCPVGRCIEGVLGGVFGEAEQAFERVLQRRTLAEVVSALRAASQARPGTADSRSTRGKR